MLYIYFKFPPHQFPQQVEVVWSKPVDKQTYNTRKTLTKVFSQF